jgi:hypothetical protein
MGLVFKVIAAVGLLYEIFPDHLRNPTALVVFGGLAGGVEVFGYASERRAQLRRQEQEHE